MWDPGNTCSFILALDVPDPDGKLRLKRADGRSRAASPPSRWMMLSSACSTACRVCAACWTSWSRRCGTTRTTRGSRRAAGTRRSVPRRDPRPGHHTVPLGLDRWVPEDRMRIRPGRHCIAEPEVLRRRSAWCAAACRRPGPDLRHRDPAARWRWEKSSVGLVADGFMSVDHGFLSGCSAVTEGPALRQSGLRSDQPSQVRWGVAAAHRG